MDSSGKLLRRHCLYEQDGSKMKKETSFTGQMEMVSNNYK